MIELTHPPRPLAHPFSGNSYLAGLFSGGLANGQTKEYKRMKKQAKGFSKVKATSDSDKELTGPKQKNCAWQAFITGRQYNVAYPDTQAVYQVRWKTLSDLVLSCLV
jgi:hypothetical protein